MNNLWTVRRFGSVTTKVQKRRDQFIRNTYPEYKGKMFDKLDHDEPRRGRRLGGSFADPSRPVLKLDGSESFYDSSIKDELEESFSSRLKQLRNDPETLTEVVSNFHEALDSYINTKEPILAERDRVIKSMSSVDYQVLSGEKIPQLPDAHHHRILSKNKFITASVPDHPIVPIKKTSPRSPKPREPDNTFPILREEQDMFPENPFHESVMTKIFTSELSLPMLDIHNLPVPSVVSGTMAEYTAAKTDAITFDVSYKRKFDISGQDALIAMDHFISAPIRNLSIGDAVHSCILDTKGYVLSLCLVSRMSEDVYSVTIDGNDAEPVFRYMAQYIVYSRQSGLDVALKAVNTCGTYIVFGPNSLMRIHKALEHENFRLGTQIPLPSTDHVLGIPPMCTVTTDTVQVARLTGDRFLISLIGDEKEGKDFITNLAPFGGAYALDMLRMESGETRPGLDIPSSTTPIEASLPHLIDQRKVREKILFGHERIAKELLKQPTHKRVGIVASKYAYAGCRILSAPHRFPIGEITSCAWSPILKKRVCQAYVKPDFAINNNPVLINLPHEIPESIDYRFRKRIVKQGNLQSVFRRLIPGKVIQFPIDITRSNDDTTWFEKDDIIFDD